MESTPAKLNFGKSLLVPNVEEIAKQQLNKIPARYVRQEQETLAISDGAAVPVIDLQKLISGDSMDSELKKLHSACQQWGFLQMIHGRGANVFFFEIATYVRPQLESPVISVGAAVPIIDLQKLISGDAMDFEQQKLHSACQQWGFLQVINHGVKPLLLEDFKREVIELFKLPKEEKKKLWQQEDSFEGFGNTSVVSEDQKLDWCDKFCLMTLPPHICKVDLFQKLPSKLRDIMEVYCKEIKSLAMIIICHLAKALRMDEKETSDLFSDGLQATRMNYYPPCPEPHRAIGLSSHSDADAFTILFQLNETEVLQVRKDDIWVPIKPLPNALIVTIGDMMEIVSNGVYRSIEHRVIVNSKEERLSVATFYFVNLGSELGPAHSLTGLHNPPIFRRVPVHKYLQDFFTRKLDGKSYLDFMKVESRDDKS